MSKIYLTKKRKIEIEASYAIIDSIKSGIWELKIAVNNYRKNNNELGATQSEEIIKRHEAELKKMQNDGWIIDYHFK